MLSTTILQDPSCFSQLEPEWNELLLRSNVNHFFMTPEFQRTWWSSLGSGKLNVITVRDKDGILRGIAPLFVGKTESGQKELNFVGCVAVSDYLDVIVDREFETEVYAKFADVLKNELNQWDRISLCSLQNTSPTRTVFRSILENMNWKVGETQQDVCPIITLPESWETYLESIGKKQRHEIERKWRKLEREVNAKFVMHETVDKNLTKTIDDFIRLHQHSNAEKNRFWDKAHVAFFHELIAEAAKAGWMRLFFLEIDGQRVATMLGFVYRDQFFLYNSGFDADQWKSLSVGNILTAYTIKYAIEQKLKIYDFLRGDEEYKFRFRAVAQPIFDLLTTR